jgi:DNA-binding beta-propeller fold protein YncE
VATQARIASVSASKTDVFFACSSSTGTGFDVWRTDLDFEQGRKIGESLRGCCGQMDVQANDNGVYVAENTKHRVSCYTRDGKSVLDFGSRERGSDASFEGCCNPMNVAFGPGRSVYTAEAGSGRVKRFSADGTFMELIGAVDLVPGCKKVSIAVSPKGDRVYMLDITRGHIVVMASSAAPPNAAASSPRTDSLTSLDVGR